MSGGSRGGRGDEKDVASDRRGLATISRYHSIVQGERADSGGEMMISIPGGKGSELKRTKNDAKNMHLGIKGKEGDRQKREN